MIRLSKSCLDEREYLAVKKVLQNEYLGMGKDVKLFEDKLSKLFKRMLFVFQVEPQLCNYQFNL